MVESKMHVPKPSDIRPEDELFVTDFIDAGGNFNLIPPPERLVDTVMADLPAMYPKQHSQEET